ncbi:MAG TPA: biotin--[acetyl-CoA-carboxylase] ligase [Acidimicrobiales bacterium]|nr:biotin--[acetyl-CoA-carboxylase] ligase [Acidimicrobiales bacterium]
MHHHSWRVEEFDEIDSTNTWLADQARAGALEGLVARADYQSAGRGRLDRRWESASASSLLCSILLRPRMASEDLALAVAAVALSAREAIGRLSGLTPSLKWPNDLQMQDRKLGGVLAEIVNGDEGAALVVGVGINLTTPGPASLRATCVLQETGEALLARDVLEALLEGLSPRRELLDDLGGRASLRDEWRAALATIGQMVRVVQTHGEIEGRALDIDEHGALVVDVAGERRVFHVGDVVHLRVKDPA